MKMIAGPQSSNLWKKHLTKYIYGGTSVSNLVNVKTWNYNTSYGSYYDFVVEQEELVPNAKSNN